MKLKKIASEIDSIEDLFLRIILGYFVNSIFFWLFRTYTLYIIFVINIYYINIL
ncbi:hypothetical protein BXY64_2892 [Marinifilum flexuosum]|uniref:Uncharacterized protein n=1 Tax=Marinifilum flexuosum TaxID=1117708 RepID=A0A419WWS9_9BACT|nr:hypothetical protein BXY64_2892 [Marinifilum flexuosum]